MTVQLQRRTFNVDDYHHMLAAGILIEDDRVELICGEIIAMATWPGVQSRQAGMQD